MLLTTFLSTISIWFSQYVDKRVKDYMFFMLGLETAMLGVFVSNGKLSQSDLDAILAKEKAA